MEPQNLQMQELYQELEDFEKKGVPHQTGGESCKSDAGCCCIYGKRAAVPT